MTADSDPMRGPHAHGAEAKVGRMIGMWLVPASVTWLAFGLVSYSNVMADRFSGGWFGFWFLGAVLVIAMFISLFLLGDSVSYAAHGWRWAMPLSVPVVIVLWIVLVANEVPLRMRYELSEGELESFAVAVLSGEADVTEEARRVGLFSVSRVNSSEGCVWLTTIRPIWRSGGFAYCVEGSTPHGRGPSGASYSHLEGTWWTWTQHTSL